MAGEIAKAGAGIQAPSKGSTFGDISSSVGAFLAGMEQRRKEEEQLALERAKILVDETNAAANMRNAAANEANAQANVDRVDLNRDEFKFNRGIAERNEQRTIRTHDLQTRELELRLQATQESLGEANENRPANQRQLVQIYGLNPQDVMDMSDARLVDEITFRRDLQLTQARNRGDAALATVQGLSELLDARAGIHTQLSSSLSQANSALLQLRNQLTNNGVFITGDDGEEISIAPIPIDRLDTMLAERHLEYATLLGQRNALLPEVDLARTQMNEALRLSQTMVQSVAEGAALDLNAALEAVPDLEITRPETSNPDRDRLNRLQERDPGGDVDLNDGQAPVVVDPITGAAPFSTTIERVDRGQNVEEMPPSEIQALALMAMNDPDAFLAAMPDVQLARPQAVQALLAANVDVRMITQARQTRLQAKMQEADAIIDQFSNGSEQPNDSTQTQSLMQRFIATSSVESVLGGTKQQTAQAIADGIALTRAGFPIVALQEMAKQAQGGTLRGDVAVESWPIWGYIEQRTPERFHRRQ